VDLDDGRVVRGRRLVVTTGLVDELPDVPGVQERWGRDVLHCPYCHGWEFRDEAIGVLGTNSWATHLALLFRQWTDDLTLFLHEAPELTPVEREQLVARGVTIVEGPVAGLDVVDDQLAAVRLADGRVVPCRALAVRTHMVARAGVLESLGVAMAEHPMGAGTYVESDPTGLTSVPGVWVAGNVTDLMAQVVGSAAAGVMAGAAVNGDLIAEDVRLAVEAQRATVRA
jgi:thioredoxin reductase